MVPGVTFKKPEVDTKTINIRVLVGATHKKAHFFMDKSEILSIITEAAAEYSKLIGRSFCFESSLFLYKTRYVICFDGNNFLHLTGVKTHLKAKEFYGKCLDKTLTADDFETASPSDPNLMMHIEMKMKNIGNIGMLVKGRVSIEERYVRGKVRCVMAASNKKFTLCFTDGAYHGKDALVPMSLLYGDTLHGGNVIENVVAKEIS